MSEIESISFYIASPEEIRTKSVYEVTSFKYDSKENTVYDPRGGALFGKPCLTCKQHENKCPGHFGRIELASPVVHPIFFSHVLNLLKIFCYNCSKIIITGEHPSFKNACKSDGEKMLTEIVKKIKKFSCCFHCNAPRREYSIKKDPLFNIIVYDEDEIEISDIEIKAIFDDVDEESVEILGIPNPRNLCLEVFPVIPPCCRPYEIVSNNLKEDDLTKLLIEIVKANCAIKAGDDSEAALHNLKFRIESYCRVPKKKSKVGSGADQVLGIRERITGKSGQMRDNLMGKRTEMSSRTVIGPDPNLLIDEVGVPEDIAKNMTFPETVYDWNIDSIKKLIVDEKIEKIKRDGNIIRVDLQMYRDVIKFMKIGDSIVRNGKKVEKFYLEQGDKIFRENCDVTPDPLPTVHEPSIQTGDQVMRRVRNGDWVLMNRQPTLWKGSAMSFKIRIHKDKTFKFNPAVCKAFNSDFDGDEQNGHFPQSIEASIEIMMLSSPRDCLLSSTNGTPVIVVLQDALLGCHLMTKDENARVSKDEYDDMLMSLSRPVSHYLNRRKEIFKVFPNREFLYSGKGLFSLAMSKNFFYQNEDLKIENGVLLSGIITKEHVGSSGKSIIKAIVSDMGKDECMSFINDIQFLANKWLLINSFSIHLDDFRTTTGISEIVSEKLAEARGLESRIRNDHLRENKLKICLSSAKDVGIKLAGTCSENNMVTTIKAGSKGDFFNLGQVRGLLGQQIIGGKRIDAKLDNGKRTMVQFPRTGLEPSIESRGFITSGFFEGLNVKDFFIHAMSGRQGVCDTAMTTFMSGYNMRKLIKLTEDIKVGNDGVVSDSCNNVYMYSYGKFGFNPENGEPNVESMIRKLNLEK